MSKPNIKRPAHRAVLAMLSRLDQSFLDQCRCYFGGGTSVVLELGEYRESHDIYFLCADREGYRLLRETVTETSLGAVARQGILLAREVRIDQYGIRTWLGAPNAKLKFEIVREARIDLSSRRLAGIPVSCLDRPTSFAEKFLANADRGLDASTLSRDAIDLAFMMAGWPQADAVAGIRVARDAYGTDIDRKLVSVTQKLREDKRYRLKCIEGLAVSDAKTLTAGLELLARDDWRGTRAK